MKPRRSRKAELAPNAMSGEKAHAETAECAEFKMTELGPIPVDWDVKRIDQCGDVVTGSTPPRGVSELWGGSFNWISAKDFKGKFIVSSEEKVTEAGKRYCRTLPANSVLVTCIASIGLNAIARRPCATNQQINAVICRDCDYEYFYYQCCFNESRLRQMAGQTAVPIIGKSQFEEFTIALPKEIKEQRRIAGALSDVDELISALGKLIEKKRNIKTGAMQQLLTGKTRLQGFGNSETQRHEGAEFKMTELGHIPVDWEVKRLGDVAKIGNGKDYKHLPEGNVPVYGTGGLMTYVNACLYDGATVCIGRKGTIDEPQYHEGKIWTVDTLFYTYDFKGVDPKFLYYLFTRINWHSYNSATGVPSLTAVTILGIDISLPPLAEQKAIAAVLSDMDAEIAALEADRAKYESIKQGMMQELLTGRTRLKP